MQLQLPLHTLQLNMSLTILLIELHACAITKTPSIVVQIINFLTVHLECADKGWYSVKSASSSWCTIRYSSSVNFEKKCSTCDVGK